MFNREKLMAILLLPILLSGCAKAEGALAPKSNEISQQGFEAGEADLANKALDKAFIDEANYPLAILLRRVFFANWPAEHFAAMRAQLHPKICAQLFGSSI